MSHQNETEHVDQESERESTELDSSLELDDKVCTVDSLLIRQDSPLGRHFARLAAELEDEQS